MHIKRLSVMNFGGIAAVNIPLQPGINVIVGENGAGKTSLLKAAATALSPIVQRATGELALGRPIELWEVRHNTDILADRTKNRYFFPGVCSAEVVTGRKAERLVVNKASGGATVSSWTDGVPLEAKKKRIVRGPLLVFYDEKCGDAFLEKTFGSKYHGYSFWYNAPLEEKNLYDWLQEESVDRNGRADMEEVGKTDGYGYFETLLSRVLPVRFLSVELNDNRHCVLIRHSNRLQLLREMSRGDRFVIRLAADLVKRIEWLNHSLTPPFEDVEGVVIIDDADQWLSSQRLMLLLKGLSMTFPKVQFIVSVREALPEDKTVSVFRLEAETVQSWLDSEVG